MLLDPAFTFNPSAKKNFMWNTVTVQYNPLIEEEYDEHFKVTCEYGYDFWKTVTFPFLDVEVATGNPVVFTLTPPECYMEIRYGYGTSGTRVTGPVRVGDPLTLIIYMRSKYDGFDIVVNDCYAHNGATKKIQLIDEYGNVNYIPEEPKLLDLDIKKCQRAALKSAIVSFKCKQVHSYNKRTIKIKNKYINKHMHKLKSVSTEYHSDKRILISRFRGSWSESGIFETQVFAYMKTFRFTGSPALYIECDVRMCHGRCPSQTCHWRNVKNVKKRSINTAATSTTIAPSIPSLSENINLFQSLRVLQEGEPDEDRNLTITKPHVDPNSICMKTGWFTALLALGGGAMCLLGGALLATCTRMRKVAIDKVLASSQFNGYMNHRGSIN
ncbi:hypothetical protein NQ317_018826 [Molorchus minor]|uniref:ZP domain-containing protein n=1 Tax=Molorchus minor TaxID=1323400 RepID=A0ABQ9ISQ6_9CUCU|nr:hypothetical protein NQ317_018826 [Molorchus minor]